MVAIWFPHNRLQNSTRLVRHSISLFSIVLSRNTMIIWRPPTQLLDRWWYLLAKMKSQNPHSKLVLSSDSCHEKQWNTLHLYALCSIAFYCFLRQDGRRWLKLDPKARSHTHTHIRYLLEYFFIFRTPCGLSRAGHVNPSLCIPLCSIAFHCLVVTTIVFRCVSLFSRYNRLWMGVKTSHQMIFKALASLFNICAFDFPFISCWTSLPVGPFCICPVAIYCFPLHSVALCCFCIEFCKL